MKILIDTNGISDGELDLSGFEKLGEVVYYDTVDLKKLYALARDCNALLVNKVDVDKRLIDNCPDLEYVGVFATGYNCIDIETCNKRGITVCNVPDYSTHPVSQHVFALLLAIYGKIREYTASVDAGDWVKSKTFCYYPYPTREMYGKVFGVYGYGSIGKAAARIAEAFGMKVIICTRTRPENCPYPVVSPEEIFKSSDVLSLHVPMTDATAKMINARTLSLMKPDAVIINTARGGLIDERALADALNSGKLAGVGLDTLSEEPMRADNPLLGAKNCLITPHIAWTALETRLRLIGIAAENLRAYQEGRPQNMVN